MTDTTATATIIRVEHVLWEPGSDWDAALGHLTSRFARVAPLDVDDVRAAPTFADQHAVVAAWAAAADVDLDRELGRFLDEHLSMHVRPDPTVTRAVRAVAATGAVHAVSVLGPRCAESLLRHAGCWRSISQLHAGIAPTTDVSSLVPGARVVDRGDEIAG